MRTFLSLLLLLSAGIAHAQTAPAGDRHSWRKLHDRGTLTTKRTDGKEQKKSIELYVTQHERIDADRGMVIVGAYVYQCIIDGEEKRLFKVVVPTGVAAQAGIRVVFFPKDLWDMVTRNENLGDSDSARLNSLTLGLNCSPEGCFAETAATLDLLIALKGSAGLLVYVVAEKTGASDAMRVSLADFAQAFEGHRSGGLPRRMRQEIIRCARGQWPEPERP